MTTPTIAAVRTALKTRFSAIANIGVVNDYERYTQQMSDLREIYVATINNEKQLRGLHFRRVSTTERFISVSRWVIDHQWTVRYFMALDDAAASEKTFDNLIEAMQDNFRVAPVIIPGGSNSDVEVRQDEEEAGLALQESAPVMFASVLCHGARLTFTTRQYE